MAPLPPSCLLLPLDGCFVLCSTITLALLLFLSRRTPGGLFVWDKSLLRAWKGVLPLPMESEANMDLPSWTQRDHDQESRGQSHEAVLDKEEGTTAQEQEPQCCRSPWKGSGHTATTIRKLLCDNATCVLCECAAREAEKVVHIQRLSPENLVLRKPSLPTTSYVERSSLPSVSALQDNPIFSRSRSEPPLSFGHLRRSLGASPLLGKRERPPQNKAQRKRPLHSTLPGTDIFPKHIRHLRHPHSKVASKGKDNFYTVDEQKVKEDKSSTSPSMPDHPCRNRAEYGHSSGVSKGCQKNQTLWGHQKTFYHHEDKDERSSSSEMDASPNSQGEDQRETHFVSEPEQDFPISSLTSSGTSSSRKMVFVPIDIPFVSEAVLEKLEQHLVAKRIQNTMGVPVVLLRSLKAFLPFAPSSNIQRPLKREVVVVTRPQVLPFKSVAIRRGLEQHVKKRAHLKYWGLPMHLQEVIRHMDFHPTVPSEEGSGRGKPQRAVKPHQLIPHLASSAGDTAFNSPLHFKPRFRVHIGKKLFQIAQETFPRRVEDSQKTTALEEKKIVLPKLIRLHGRHPQLRGGPSLGLRRKADCVEMNIKYKHIQFLWDLPTLYSESLSERSPEAFNLPGAPPQVFPRSEFVHAETPFLPISQRQRLDSHVLRKRVHHQWGQPRLVQQSLWRFLSAAPPADTLSPVPTKCHRVDIKVAPASTLSLIPVETNRKLEDHVRRKAIERQWGIPRRVMTSLQTFMPMPSTVAKTAREREKEKVQKRSPPVKEPSLCEFPQVLQRHVAKKALEIHLGSAGPSSTLLQIAAPQEREDALPRIISPESRTLQLRPKELHFVELMALDRIELSIRHKDLAHKWGLPTWYKMSLSYLFTGVEFKGSPPPLSRKGIVLDFSSSDPSFISRGTRKDLEWHVRRKRMQHTWGLAGLAQKSLQLLRPDAPPLHTAGHTEVATLPAQITFLGDASVRELERNVLKRVVLQRWRLPGRALEPAKRLGPEVAAASGPGQERGKPGRVAVAPPHRPEALHTPRGTALKEMEFHLDKKHMEILLGVVPALVRLSRRGAFLAQGQPLPKLIPPGRSFLQPRCRLLPFERPEDLARIEQALRHRSLMSLWGLSTQFLEALGGMTPKPSLQPPQPGRADRLLFSEAEPLFLREQDRGAFEGHLRRKRLQSQWGLPGVVQRSLRGFMGGAPPQRSHQNTVIRVQVLYTAPSFLPWDSGRSLELHMRRRKQRRQWGLPGRVLEALQVPESVAGPRAKQREGVDQGPLGLGPLGLPSEAVAVTGEEGSAPRPPSPGAASPPEALRFGSKAEKKIQLLFLKKCVEVHTGVFPGVARQSWQCLPPSRAPLLKPVPPGSRVPQPRSHFLPFARAEDISRLELAILRHRLASLWGLGRVYVEGTAALRPELPSSHRRPREGEAELSADGAISLPAQVRGALELHVQKKRLGHEWGFPGLIRKSLRGFVQSAPPPPSLPKTERYARILCRSPAFLPLSTCTHLESHLRRRQLRQRWRLPAKALQSFKLLYPRLEPGPSDPRSNGDEEVPLYCLGHGAVSEHPAVDLVCLEPGGDMETADSWGATPQGAQVLSTVDPKDMDQIQILLTKKNMEVQLEAIPNIAGLAWTQSSSRQHLPKLIPPGFQIQQLRTSSLPFFHAWETEQIEMAIRCNHLASLGSLGTHYADVLSAMHFNPFSECFRLRRTGIEFSEAQTLFLQEQERQDLESHVAKKKIQHTWGFPVLVQKSVKSFMQGLPIAPIPQRSMLCVHIIPQVPSFLPQDISSRLEFHVQKMNFQRQWGLPRRALTSLWLLCPAGEDADVQRPMTPMSHLDQTWRNIPRDPSSETAPGGWPAGAQSTEQDLRKKSEVMSALEPQSLERLQLHLAKKYMEVQHGVLPTIAKASLQLTDLYSKRRLSKLIHSGHGLLRLRNISLLTVPTEDRDHFEWTVQRNHFHFLWGLGPRYEEALAGMMPEFASSFSRHRWANKDFLEMQTFFLQKKDREALEGHIKKKRIQHIWSCPLLVQRSMECFMPRAPLCPSTQKVETNTRIMLHELLFLPPNTQTHLEHHIQKRKLLQRWGLPKQMLSSLKIFLPTASEMQAPVSPTKEFWEEPKNQEWKPMIEMFSLKQKSALQSHLKRKHLEMHLGVDSRLVKQSQDKAHGLEREHLPILIHPGQKCPTDRTQSLLYLPPHTLNKLELNVRHKYLTFLWGLPSQYLESLSRMTSTVPISNPPKQQIFHFQGVETPYLQGKEKEALEHHVKKKRLQHQWVLPAAVQRSLQAFASSLLVPIHPPKRVGEDMKIQVQRPLFLPGHSQENLEDSLKRMIIHQQWGLPKKIHDSLRAFSAALPVRTQQPYQKKAGPDLNYYFAKKSNLKNHLRRKSTEITLQSRTAHNILLTDSLYSERDPRSTTQPPGATSAIDGKGPNPRTPQDEAIGLLEFHILHKKICHEWGLPFIVQKSLLAFCPPLLKPQADRGTVGESLEMAKEDGAAVGENIFQDNEMKFLGGDQQVTKEEVSESPQDSERDSVSTEATEMDKLDATGGLPQSSKETSSTGGNLRDSKEESHEPVQGTEKGRFASKTLQPLTKTRTDIESPRARAKSPTNPQSPQAPEEAGCERPETIEDNSPETAKRTTVPSKSPQAAAGANVAGLPVAALVAGEAPKGSSGARNGSVASGSLRAAEERSAVGSTLRGDAAAESGRHSPAAGAPRMAGEGTPGVAEEEAVTGHSRQVEPGNAASQSPHARDETGIAGPPTIEELSVSIGSPRAAEGTAASGKGSQATEGLAIEAPQALEETVGASKLPHGEEYRIAISPKSETLQSIAPESPLAVEQGRPVAGTPAMGEAKTTAVTAAAEGRVLPGEPHAEEPQPVKDTRTADGRRPPAAEQIAVVNQHQAEKATNAPDKAPPTLEGGMSPHVPLGVSPSGSLIPEAAEEANVPEKRTGAKGEAETVVGDSRAPGSDGSPEMSWMERDVQAREEQSIVLGETTKGSCPEEQEEELRTSGKSSEAASKEGTPSEGLSCPEEVNTEQGPLLAGAEGRLPGQHPGGAAAAERPPEEGGMRDAGGSCQVAGGQGTLAEGPQAAEGKGTLGKSLARDRMDLWATPLGGQAPERTQELFKTFLPHLESRFHSYYKPAGVHFLAETEPKSHSSPPKKSPVYRAELCLQLEHGGRIGPCVSTEKPPCSFSPEALPVTEASEGGSSQDAEPETRKARRSGPKGRSSHGELELRWDPRAPLQQDTPKRGLRALHGPAEYGNQSLPLPQPSCYKYDASCGASQASDSAEFSSLESPAESMPSGAIEQLPWDKDRLSRQLERSIQGMVRHSAPPSGLRRPVTKCATYSPYEGGTTVGERDVDQRWEQQGEAFSMANDAGARSMVSLEDNETQNKTHCAGSLVQGYLPGQENLLKPSEGEAHPRLRTHVTQRALGSFVLPACVISSNFSYEDVEVGLIRQAGREHRQKLSAQLLEEKLLPEEESESPPEQGHSLAGDAGRPLMSAALYPGEPKDWAGRYLCEPPPPPPSLSMSRTSLEQQDHEGSQKAEEAGEASSAGSEVSKHSSKKFSSVSTLEAGSELPAPPSDWLQSGTEDEGAERECEDHSSLVIKDVPQMPHHRPTQHHPRSLEDQSQFSTECEWERVGDWDSESLTEEKDSSDLDLEERPPEGSSLKAEASSQLWAKSASSSSRTDNSKGLFLIGSIVERKLSLKQGLNIWQSSQGRRLATWTEKNGHGAPRGEEEAREAAEGRAGFSGDAQRAPEGEAAERWVDARSALQSEEEPCQRGGTHVPPAQTFLTGFHNRSSASTSSTSTHCQADRSSTENDVKGGTLGPEEELAWDRPGNKASALTAAARRRRNPKTRSPESPAERGAGGGLWGSSQRRVRPGWRDRDSSSREQSSSSSREERPSGGTPGGEGRPATLLQGAARIRGRRSGRRRKDSLLHGVAGDPPLPRAEQEDGAGQPTAGGSPRNRGGSSERGILRWRPQECRAAGREGSPLEDIRGALGGHRAFETRAAPGGPQCPLPEGEQLRSLREKILLRRKELWSSPDSEEENPG